MIDRAVSFLQKDTVIWGPIFLLGTLAIGTQTPFDLVLLALVGLYLCARYKIRGCCYSLVLLGLFAIVKHAFFTQDHLWQLGLESSLGCAFFITALAFEQGEAFLDSLKSQIQTRKAALENLEEELSKAQQEAQEQQMAFQERVALLQKELEELQSDHSSILILNEVLRKTTARAQQENEMTAQKLLDQQRQFDLLKSEYEECEKDLLRLSNTDIIVQQNKELMQELNAARYEKEQTYLINETLARLYLRENLKVKEAEQEASSLSEQLAATHKEVQRVAEPLKEQLTLSRKEIETLSFQFERANLEADQGRSALLKLQEVQTERNFLKERLAAALEELSHVQRQAPACDPQMEEQLKFAQEKLVHLSQMEPLFKQLKKQFEEKTLILHQTRSDLFKSDTELQKLKLEKGAFELNPIPKEVEQELQLLGEQLQSFEEENQHLQELVSLLSDPTNDAAKRKKKLKTQSPPEQELLF